MSIINTKNRSEAIEIMDDFDMKGDVLQKTLDQIASINQFLGGNKITIQGVEKLINKRKNRKITIIDVGCGNGDILRELSSLAQKKGYIFELIGIDANQFSIDYAIKLSEKYPNITYQCLDIFEDKFLNLKCDILVCTLTLHHFKNDEILKLMKLFYNNSSIGVLINDLHRNMLAYRLFQALSNVFNLNHMSKQDGLISILKGFKKQEIITFCKQLNFQQYVINWRWAFRYEWIIFK
jgi:2-polyprenyl-3-methyl-5-hydroxy-6-metoxy-1,4-benzoquinol methylase